MAISFVAFDCLDRRRRRRLVARFNPFEVVSWTIFHPVSVSASASSCACLCGVLFKRFSRRNKKVYDGGVNDVMIFQASVAWA